MSKAVMILAANTPDYITVKETAEAWGVSKRYVNMCIEDGRIPDTVRMGNMWLVPKGADKRIGTNREKKKAPEKSLSSELAYIVADVDSNRALIDLYVRGVNLIASNRNGYYL